MAKIQIRKWGNDLGFRLPGDLVEQMNLNAGDSLEVIPFGDGWLIKKAETRRQRYALAEILASFAPAGTQATVDFGKAQGKEIW